ncbi:MAG: carotenoid biosynthesis protein [Gammaproteobacteria bacterium]
MSPMPKLESFTVKASLLICALAAFSLVAIPVLGTQDLGTPGAVIGVLLIVAICILHAIATKGPKKALGFVVIAAVIAWFVEFIGCNYGWWFGDYEYTDELGPMIGNVPIMVVISWEGIIYPSMILVDEFLSRKAPMSRAQHLVHIAIASLATGLVVTAWDFLADPVSVNNGFWKWDNGGGYVPDIHGGIPFSNFGLMGWVGAVFMIAFLYRLWFTDEKTSTQPSQSATLVATALYTAWFCNAIYANLHWGGVNPAFYQVVLVGCFVMGPVVVLSWGRVYSAWKTGDR